MGLFFKKETPSNKIGRVRKCPQCGASVPSSKVVCPECGWEFDDGEDRQSAVQRLAAELKKSQGFFGTRSEGEVVRAFPIPKTKNDLLELTIYFKSRKSDLVDIGTGHEKMQRKVYNEKYEECIAKAKQFYANDSDFAGLIAEYDRSKKNKLILIIVGIALAVCLLALGIWSISTAASKGKLERPQVEDLRSSKKSLSIEESIALGDESAIIEAIKATKKIKEPLPVLEDLVRSNYLDAAIYLFNNKTSHCSTYEMQYETLHSNAGFTKKATKLLYNALIAAERWDEAWEYHPLEYDDPDYAGNANCYYQYIMDVINYYCKKGNKATARKFVKEHLVWFVSYVDNGEWGHKYPDFQSAKVNQRLTKYINNY